MGTGRLAGTAVPAQLSPGFSERDLRFKRETQHPIWRYATWPGAATRSLGRRQRSLSLEVSFPGSRFGESGTGITLRLDLERFAGRVGIRLDALKKAALRHLRCTHWRSVLSVCGCVPPSERSYAGYINKTRDEDNGTVWREGVEVGSSDFILRIKVI